MHLTVSLANNLAAEEEDDKMDNGSQWIDLEDEDELEVWNNTMVRESDNSCTVLLDSAIGVLNVNVDKKGRGTFQRVQHMIHRSFNLNFMTGPQARSNKFGYIDSFSQSD